MDTTSPHPNGSADEREYNPPREVEDEDWPEDLGGFDPWLRAAEELSSSLESRSREQPPGPSGGGRGPRNGGIFVEGQL